jgi:predicted membrane protein
LIRIGNTLAAAINDWTSNGVRDLLSRAGKALLENKLKDWEVILGVGDLEKQNTVS